MVLPSPPGLPDGSRDPGEAEKDFLGINPSWGHRPPGGGCEVTAQSRSWSGGWGCGSFMGENKTPAWVTTWGFSGRMWVSRDLAGEAAMSQLHWDVKHGRGLFPLQRHKEQKGRVFQSQLPGQEDLG